MRGLATPAAGARAVALLALLGACSLPSVDDFLPPTTTEPEPDATTLPPPVFEPIAGFEVVEVVPDIGAPKGFELVELHGGGFRAESRVYFGGSEAVQVTVASAGVIYALTPPHSPGLVSVRVVNLDGTTAELSPGFAYTDPVTLLSIEPSEGPQHGGTPVVITGTGLRLATAILVGGREVVSFEVLDDSTALAVLPGRSRPGLVDVHLVTPFGTTELPRAFRYVAPLSIEGLSPLAGPAQGGGTLTIAGQGLMNPATEPGQSPAPRILVGGVDAPVLAVDPAGTRVVARVPAGPAGPADVEVVTQVGRAAVEAGYIRLGANEAPRLVALYPRVGSVTGGAEVQLVAVGAPGNPTVWFGTEPAEVLDERAGADGLSHLTVLSPAAGQAGAVEVRIDGLAGAASYGYEAALGVSGVTPASGPREGGTSIVIEGTGLAEVSEVLIGGLPASELQLQDDGTLRALSPAGSPGPADVVVRTRHESGVEREAIRPQGFEYRAGHTGVHALDPARGAIAGNTLVRVYGVDLPEDVKVSFGGAPVASVTRVSSAELQLVTPRATDVGLVDVRITGTGLDTTLYQGYAYFDPITAYGGTWGEPIDGSLNVTVVQNGTGDRVAEALVVIGSELPPRLAGYTDDRGQVTLSAADLEGRLDVTAAKAGYSSGSIIAFDAENATLLLSGPAPPSSGPGPTPLQPGNIEGTVEGVGKYLRLPPWPCAELPGRSLGFCGSCEVDSDCPGTAPLCTRVSGARPFCSATCATNSDCAAASSYIGSDPDFICSQEGEAGDGRCIPNPGRPRAECFVANTSYLQGPSVALGDGVIDLSTDDRDFRLGGTRLGELAVYCLAGGYRDTVSGPAFKPVLLGVARHQTVLPGVEPTTGAPNPATRVVVTLDIPLESAVDLYFGRQPLAATGPTDTTLLAHVALGSDGYIPVATQAAPPGATSLEMQALPALNAASLVGSEYVFYGTCATPGAASALPEADIQRVGISALELGQALVNRSGSSNGWVVEPTGTPTRFLTATTFGDGTALAGARSGAVLHYDGTNWSPQPITRGPALYGSVTTGLSTGGALLVGDEGHVVSWDGVTWSVESTGAHSHRGIARLSPGQYVLAGRYSLLEGSPGAWQESGFGPPKDLTAVAAWGNTASAAQLGRAVAVGMHGAILMRATAGQWRAVAAPVYEHLRAVWAAPSGRALAVGDRGTAVIIEADGVVTPLNTGVDVNLYGLAGTSDDEVYAVGDDGTVLYYDGQSWSTVASGRANTGLRTIVHTHVGGSSGEPGEWLALGEPAIRVGPFLDVPAFTAPAPGGPWFGYRFAWSHEGRAAAFHSLRLYSQTGMIWSITAPGALSELRLPDLNAIAGETLVPIGPKSALMTSADHPYFNIDGYDREVSDLRAWRAWTYRLHEFDQVLPGEFLE